MKIELLLKIQRILELLLSLVSEIENAKEDVQNDCYLMHEEFDTERFKNIITSFFKMKPSRNVIEDLQEKVLEELTCSCVHKFVEDDIECNMEDLHINYCILCGIKNTDSI